MHLYGLLRPLRREHCLGLFTFSVLLQKSTKKSTEKLNMRGDSWFLSNWLSSFSGPFGSQMQRKIEGRACVKVKGLSYFGAPGWSRSFCVIFGSRVMFPYRTHKKLFSPLGSFWYYFLLCTFPKDNVSNTLTRMRLYLTYWIWVSASMVLSNNLTTKIYWPIQPQNPLPQLLGRLLMGMIDMMVTLPDCLMADWVVI